MSTVRLVESGDEEIKDGRLSGRSLWRPPPHLHPDSGSDSPHECPVRLYPRSESPLAMAGLRGTPTDSPLGLRGLHEWLMRPRGFRIREPAQLSRKTSYSSLAAGSPITIRGRATETQADPAPKVPSATAGAFFCPPTRSLVPV